MPLILILLLSLSTIVQPARAEDQAAPAGTVRSSPTETKELLEGLSVLDAPPNWHYDKTGKRNPFQPPPELANIEVVPTAQAIVVTKPKRTKEYLESFQLDSLKLVATVFRIEGHGPVAMVEDPMGVGHMVQPGQYLGTNEGRIKTITDGTVVIEEQQPDQGGAVPTRTVTLRLPSEVKK
ncbi:MAG: pilus assembly protein PilP [Magnetococcales bacterium]|nr:pilus assembly protein PilP [Magnetococcales bacterium]